MKLIIDDGDIEKIKEISDYFPIAGVTTNPSILAASGRRPYEVLSEIREFIGVEAELHVQVISQKAADMVEEGYRIGGKLGERTFVKIPVTKEGLKAIRILSARGVSVTATAIYTPMQGYLAGQAGALYAAPYINRIDNLGGDGVQAAKDIHDIFAVNNLKTEVLAASFKNTRQVLELVKYGIGAVTVSPDVIEGFLKLDMVDCAVRQFCRDFEELCGTGETM